MKKRKPRRPSTLMSTLSTVAIFSLGFTAPLSADIILDFSGKNRDNQAVKATLYLKDSYQFNEAVDKEDFIQFVFTSPQNDITFHDWHTKDIQATFDEQGKPRATGRANQVILYDQNNTKIFATRSSGRWQVLGRSEEGFTGSWTLRK